ncbi:MAG: PEP-CTERM sorting domain-containing protein [Chthoniobacteraceae bacterium]|nr:PEP-CTERM sorting domain-containing protein [Chthoniobacteraceae bacterium]
MEHRISFKHHPQSAILALLALALLSFLPSHAQAQGTTLKTSGTWNNANNWTNGVPGYTTTAFVDGNLTVSAAPGVTGTAFCLFVGESGTGSLNINGGSLLIDHSILGDQAGSLGAATVTSGTWTSAAELVIGGTGSGTLTVQGGTVTSPLTVIGAFAGSSGTATVSGGSWTNIVELDVGGYGTGTLNLSVSGGVSLNNGPGRLTVAQHAGSTGTLNLGTGGTAGTLNATAVIGGEGASTVNFNHTGTYTFDAGIQGIQTINKLGAGTTVLTDANSSADLTNVIEGELDVNGTLLSTVRVGNGAALRGSGTTGIVSLVGGPIGSTFGSPVLGIVGGTLHADTITGHGTVTPGDNGAGILTTRQLHGGGGLFFDLELHQAAPDYGNAADSKNGLVHVTDGIDSLSSLDRISLFFDNATPGSTYLGGLFVDNLSAALLGDAVNNASFLYYVLDTDGTATTPGDIYYDGNYYASLDAWLVRVSAIDLTNVLFETGNVATGSETTFTIVPEPGTWAMLALGTGLLAFRKRLRRQRA